MLDIVYYVAASLDGYIAPSDGGVEWLAPFENSDEDYGYAEFYASVEAVLLGRATFEQSLTFGDWPYPDKACWVFTHGAHVPPIPNVTFTDRPPARFVTELEARGICRAWLVGGGALAASFRAQGLISEYIVSVIPVVLGAGIPLFDGPGPQERLQLKSSQSFSSGIVQMRYVAL
jgi:dihydrofolate reductase